jgi:hypothetical protein
MGHHLPLETKQDDREISTAARPATQDGNFLSLSLALFSLLSPGKKEKATDECTAIADIGVHRRGASDTFPARSHSSHRSSAFDGGHHPLVFPTVEVIAGNPLIIVTKHRPPCAIGLAGTPQNYGLPRYYGTQIHSDQPSSINSHHFYLSASRSPAHLFALLSIFLSRLSLCLAYSLHLEKWTYLIFILNLVQQNL